MYELKIKSLKRNRRNKEWVINSLLLLTLGLLVAIFLFLLSPVIERIFID